MFFAISAGRRIHVRAIGAGDFFCLYCEAERSYQHREWRSSARLFFLPVADLSGGEFVLCCTCNSTFDVECLDESSTAFCDELMIEVPDFAIRARIQPRSPDAPAEFVAAAARGSISAHSAFRRH